MCGRYRWRARDIRNLAAKLGISYDEAEHLAVSGADLRTDRYNMAPMQRGPVIRANADGQLEVAALQWGLIPSWARDSKIASSLINARAETAATKPAFRDSFRNRRCLVVAGGYYEWEAVGKVKQPWHFGLEDEGSFAFAGLWSVWRPQGAAAVETYTILTCEPNELAARWHDRMPVVFHSEDYRRWITAPSDEAAALLRPYGGEMKAYRVTPKMNNWRFEEPAAAEPLSESISTS